MVNEQWKTDADIDIGDDAFIVSHLESIDINNAQDAWQTARIENKNIVLLRDELNKIIEWLELDKPTNKPADYVIKADRFEVYNAATKQGYRINDKGQLEPFTKG